MAGEWLKFECSLPEKPETLAITVAMGWDDPDLTVGKLMRLFRWFDQHTVDGNAVSVTPALLDRLIGATGFVQAVANSGWLAITEAGLSLVHFDRHNGMTAKNRAQTAKRVASYRANSSGADTSNDANVTPPLAREEKKREEKKEYKAQAPLPDWLPQEPWAGYVEMRKRIRKPMTARAEKLVLNSLSAMHERGISVAAALDNSTKSNWVDVYEPKPGAAKSDSLGSFV